MALNIRNKLCCILLLWAVFCVSSKAQDKIFLLMEPEELQKHWQQGEMCCEEVGYPVSFLKGIFKWPVPNVKIIKQIYQCIRYNTGFTDKNGHMVEEKFRSLSLLNGTQEEVIEVLRRCNKITLEDPVETNYVGGDCLSKSCVFATRNKETGNIDIVFKA